MVRIAFVVVFAVAAVVACGSNDEASPGDPLPSGDAGADVAVADAGDAGDPRCQTQPVALADHPWAVKQASEMGKNLRNVRGFHGRVYFGYGDLNANTGPIDIASYDPVGNAWTNHLTLQTESVERFVPIGSELWATCSDGHGPADGGCEYASGDANHGWTTHDVSMSIHVMDVTERVPGDVLLGGSWFLDSTSTTTGAFLWRSVSGAPFTQAFPGDIDAGYVERGGGPFMGLATLHAVTYAVAGGSVWAFDGTTWAHARTPGNDVDPVLLGDFLHPVTFADHIVFGTFGGTLFKFDGKRTERLGVRTFDTPTAMGFTEAPVVIFEASEGHLLAVNETGDLLASTDLVSFQCIGKAPPDVRSVGSLDGVVYFGGAQGHVYRYAQPSW